MEGNIDQWVTALCEMLKKPLPGSKAHVKLAPDDRKQGLIDRNWPIDAKKSAVTFLLFPVEKQWHTVLMKRVVYNGVHSGQISFPGGQMELNDRSLLKTAQREFQEETGVVLNSSDYIGALTELYIPPSNFLVQTYVAILSEQPHFIPDDSEVQELHIISLQELFLTENFRVDEIVVRERENGSYIIKAPCYNVKGLCIWGATAMMISELQYVFKEQGFSTLLQ